MRAWLALALACGCLDAPPARSVETGQGFLADPVQLPLAGEDGWSPADLSAYLPDGASGALLAILDRGGEANRIGLRKSGSSDARNAVSGADNFHAGVVGVDADRVFEYWIEDAGSQQIWLLGWTAGEALFFDQAVEVSTELPGEWVDVDVGALPGCQGAIGAYLEHVGSDVAAGWGVRMAGSSDDRVPGSADPRHGWMLVGLDAGGRFQQYVEGTTLDLWVVGCQLAGAVFHREGIERAPAEEGSWADLPAPPAGAIGAVYEMGVFTTPGCDFGVRPAGSTVSLEGRGKGNGHAWALSAAGAGGGVEGFRETPDCHLWELGYFTR